MTSKGRLVEDVARGPGHGTLLQVVGRGVLPQRRDAAKAEGESAATLLSVSRRRRGQRGEPSPGRRGQRLSFGSSVLVCPWSAVSEDGIEDCEELSSDGHDGDELWLAGFDELVSEGFEGWIVTRGDERPHVEGGPDAGSSAADEALAAPASGLARPRREAGQRCDLAAIEAAEFRQLCDQRASDGGADSGHGGEKVFLLTPGWRGLDGVVDIPVHGVQFSLKGFDQPGDTSEHLGWSDRLALLLGGNHRDDLPTPCDKGAQEPGIFIPEGADVGRRGFDEVSNHGSVDRIGLGTLPQGVGESSHLRRVDDHNRQACAGEPGCHGSLEPSGRLEPDCFWQQRLQPFDQRHDAFGVARNTEAVLATAHMDIKPVLRDVDADDDSGGVHPVPSLRKRASLAAQATVRVQWTGERRPLLPYGLKGPKRGRSHARHRTGHYARCSANQVTRERCRPFSA